MDLDTATDDLMVKIVLISMKVKPRCLSASGVCVESRGNVQSRMLACEVIEGP